MAKQYTVLYVADMNKTMHIDKHTSGSKDEAIGFALKQDAAIVMESDGPGTSLRVAYRHRKTQSQSIQSIVDDALLSAGW